MLKSKNPSVLVVGAMYDEVSPLVKKLKGYQYKYSHNNEPDYGKGYLIQSHGSRVNVYVASIGIGKVNAALAMQALLHKIRPDIVLNVGTAGTSIYHVNDIILCKGAAYRDVDPDFGDTAMKFPHGRIYNALRSFVLANYKNAKSDYVYTGDTFCKEGIPDKFVYDMESAVILHVCSMKCIPCSVLRVISDTVNHSEYRSNRDYCHKIGCDIILNFIKSYEFPRY